MAEGEQAPPPYVDVATYSTVESSSPYPEATQHQQAQSYPHVQQPARPQAKRIILAIPVRSPEEIAANKAAKKAERDRREKEDARNTWICCGVCGVIILLVCVLIFVLIAVGNASGNYIPLYVLLAVVFTFCVIVCGCCGKQENRSCGGGVFAVACLVGK